MSIPLYELLDNLYGIKSTYQINKQVSQVQNTITKILDNNPNRASFIIVNLSANNIFISPDSDVSSTRGVFVAPNGGNALFQWDRDFELPTHEFFAIAGAINSDVFILENILV